MDLVLYSCWFRQQEEKNFFVLTDSSSFIFPNIYLFFSNLLFFLSPTEWNRIDAPSVMDLVFDEGKIEIEIKRKINNC